MKVKEGQYVRHSQYGWGTVLDCDKHQTTVLFRSIGVKRLAASSANFATVGGEASRKKPAN
jgi:PcrA/UvrD tudor domain